MRALYPILALATLLLLLGSASAQEVGGDFEVSLLTDKDYHGLGETFSLSASASSKAEKVGRSHRFTLSVYQRILPHENLFDEGALDGRPRIVRRTIFKRLKPGENSVLSFSRSTADLKMEPGVYPAVLTGVDGAGNTRSAVTYLNIMPVGQGPLSLALVLNLAEPVTVGPDGVFVENRLAGVPRPVADSPFPVIDRVAASPSVPVTVVLRPTTIRQVEKMTTGFTWTSQGGRMVSVGEDSPEAEAARQLVARFRSFAGMGDRVAIGTTPLGSPSLPALAANGWESDGQGQVSLGKQEIETFFGSENLASTVYPPGLTIDPQSAGWLESAGFSFVVLDRDSLPGPESYARLLPHQVGPEGRLLGFFVDRQVSDLLGSGSGEESWRRKMVALLAQRHIFGADRDGLITVVMDGPGQKQVALDQFLSIVEAAPWLEGTTIPAAGARFPVSEAALNMSSSEDTGGVMVEAVSEAREAYQSFAVAAGIENEVVKRVRDELYLAQSADWWRAEDAGLGRDYAKAVTESVENEFGKVTLMAQEAVTFSGPEGKVPVAVVNQADYPLSLTLKLAGKGFEIPDDNSYEVRLTPKENLESYPVKADFTGARNISVVLASGDRVVATGSIEVRVADFSTYIMGGAGLLATVLGAAVILRRRGRKGRIVDVGFSETGDQNSDLLRVGSGSDQ